MPTKIPKSISLLGCLLGIILVNLTCQRIDLSPEDPTSGVKIKLGIDGFRSWEDGSYACNCREYRYPAKTGYVFAGDAESGLY